MTIRPIISFILGAIVAISSLNSPIQVTANSPQTADAPQAPFDIPDTLISSDVSDFTIAAPKLFWSTHSLGCPVPLAASSADTPPAPKSPANVPNDEYVRRISIYGSETRIVWQNITTVCATSHILASNIAADSDFIYWTTGSALMRQSTNANASDAPEVVTTEISGTTELAIDSVYVHVLKALGSSGNYTAKVWSVKKSDKAVTPLVTRTGLTSYPNSIASSSGSRVSAAYIYWREGNVLMRYSPTTSAIGSIAASVSNYYAEGPTTFCLLVSCMTSDYVFIANGASITRFNNVDSASDGVIYTAPANHTVQHINSDRSKLFLNLRETLACPPDPDPCFNSYTDHLYRRGRNSTGTTDLLYSASSPSISGNIYGISTASDYVFWQEGSAVKRLPKDAAALPKTNMKITGASITQGIQKPDNSVILIKDRKTFVRVFVKSDGPGNVSGVTARLNRLDGSNNVIGTVLPANQPTNITVRTSPNRSSINDSFLFELPWSWVSGGSVKLQASLNPYHSPVESSYADNNSSLGTFTLNTSAALKVNFISWGYSVDGKTYWPRFIKDIVQTYSWVSRAYPLASKIVFDGASGNSPGFHPNLWFQYDDSLGAKVMRTHAECQDLLVKNPDNTVKSDNRSMCASRYTNYQMVAMRSENGLPAKRFFYGFISDEPKFPRGQACCGTAVSSGPAGAGDWGWDFDGSYADWYAAHEIGHTLGRAHPDAGSDNPATKNTSENCGHSRSDAGFPYGNTSSARAPIGIGDAEGFDGGDASLGIARAIYPSSIWNDVMSYCDSQWMSDYTYKGMYDFMKNSPPPLVAQQTVQEAALPNSHVHPDGSVHMHTVTSQAMNENSPMVNGDFLQVNGTIISGTDTASLQNVVRVNSVPEIPALGSGPYAIRLYDNANTQLASYSFDSEAYHHASDDILQINQVITVAVGTRSLKIVRLADNLALITKTVSANAPIVTNVILPGAPNPVSGTTTVAWTASDADGDALTFDVFYSPDGGTTLQPVASGITGNSTQVDTTALGGSTNARFRVVAHDGVNTGAANSVVFTMANKAPQPMIIDPSTGHTVQYGQLVNFSGAALDWQDGGVTGINLAWSTKDGVLGTGELVSSDALPVGDNVITLTATNSKGLSASTNITVVVQDNLDLAGPTLIVDRNQVSWQFAKDANLLADQEIEVGNAGSGELTWSASTSAPWLTISPITGTAPTSITLTADPSAIANGTALTGTVMINAPATDGQPAQSLTIKVGLAKDISAYTYSGAGPEFKVHMPTLLR